MFSGQVIILIDFLENICWGFTAFTQTLHECRLRKRIWMCQFILPTHMDVTHLQMKIKNCSNKCCKSWSRLLRKSFIRCNNGTKLLELMLLTDVGNVASDPFYLPIYKNQTLSPISTKIDNHTKFMIDC